MHPDSLVRRIIEKFGIFNDGGLPYNHVELFYWRPEDGVTINFGDFLSHAVVAQMLALHNRSLGDETPKPHRLLAIGSIIHYARQGNILWGSGINGREGQNRAKVDTLDVRAVRGPMTREILCRQGFSVPEIYGDPALLIPRIFPGRFSVTRERPYVFVPNIHDMTLCRGEPAVVSPLLGWNKCIEAILSAELVLASSLHGLVIAEAYGVPARYERLSESENLFKYRDYYAGTGRDTLEFATSIKQGLEMGGDRGLDFDGEPLMQAFPIDVWG